MASRSKRKPVPEEVPPIRTFEEYEADCRKAIAEMESAYRARGEPVPRITFQPSLGILVSFDDEQVHYSSNGTDVTPSRHAIIQRKTAETQLDLSLNLDGTGKAEIATGIGFLDHMLTLFAKHSLIDLKVQAKGDLHVDP